MEKAFGGSTVALYLFFYVLPGLFGSLVYDYVVEGEKRETIDRIATALVLTLISLVALHYLTDTPIVPTLEVTNDTRVNAIMNAFLGKNLLYASLFSAFIAATFAASQNHGWIYAVLRWLRLTRKTGECDIWQQVFYRYYNRWLCLEFKDGRRLVGWPMLFSSTGRSREILVADATWLLRNDGGETERSDVVGPGVYLSNFDEIVSIEVLD